MQVLEEKLAAERERIYAFLAGVFSSPPTADGLRALSQMALTLGISCPEGLSLRELDREFMDLFVVPNPRYVAPYESVYRDRWQLGPGGESESGEGPDHRGMAGPLMGESTMGVRQVYLQVGILPKEELPDHIANELRFMAYTWARQGEAQAAEAPAWAELRERFRREHLLLWIGQLREKVAERERLGYYRAALQLVEVVLQEDACYADA